MVYVLKEVLSVTIPSWGVKTKATGERETHCLLLTESKTFPIIMAVASPQNLVG